MTKLYRTYSVSLKIELETSGSDYEDCRSQMRDKLKFELNKLVYDQQYHGNYRRMGRGGGRIMGQPLKQQTSVHSGKQLCHILEMVATQSKSSVSMMGTVQKL